MTFFDTHKEKFQDSKIIDGKVETKPFLDAASVLVILLEGLGSAFSPVKNDIQGNINKIMKRYTEHPETSKTFQDIVLGEMNEKHKVATDAILWLKRALEFTSLALRLNIQNAAEELSASFSKAYSTTLSKHHSFMVRPVFTLAMSACPNRKSFYEKLAEGGDLATLMKQLDFWVAGLEEKLKIIVDFYVAQKLA